MNEIKIKKQGFISKLADRIMMPVMYLVSGTISESPQRTHFWNNNKLTKKDISNLDSEKIAHIEGISDAARKSILPIFHMPIFGGWKDYVVLEPENFNGPWQVGWITNDYSGISNIQIHGSVRMLISRDTVSFFGISSGEQTQIKIMKIGEGRIGESKLYKKIPLL